MSELHIKAKNRSIANGKSAILRNKALLFVVTLFITPKLFGYFQTVELTQLQRWLYIIITDLIPAIFIFIWVRKNSVRKDSKKTESFHAEIDPLLFIRFCACLMVLLGHYFLVIFSPPVQLTNASLVYRLTMSSPWAGVWIFFTLSGYLMGKGFFSGRYSLHESGIATFYFNRATRILPIFIFALLAQWLFLSPEIFKLENIWGLVQTLTLDQNQWFSVGALWSVATEFQFYLMAPFLAIAIGALDSKVKISVPVIAVTILTGLALSFGMAEHHNWDHTLILLSVYMPIGPNLFMFVSGMLLAKLLADRPKTTEHNWTFIGVPFFIAVIIVMTLWISYSGYGKPLLQLSKYWIYAPPLATAGTLATIYIFETGSKIESGFARYIIKATQYGGMITYCLYAFHSQLMEQIRKIAPPYLEHHSELLYLPLAVALIWGVSHFCYKIIEKPLSEIRR